MYESPVQRHICSEIAQKIDDLTYQAVAKANITVDRDELIKALEYDRGQYDKGYRDGRSTRLASFKAILRYLIETLQKELKDLEEGDTDGMYV